MPLLNHPHSKRSGVLSPDWTLCFIWCLLPLVQYHQVTIRILHRVWITAFTVPISALPCYHRYNIYSVLQNYHKSHQLLKAWPRINKIQTQSFQIPLNVPKLGKTKFSDGSILKITAGCYVKSKLMLIQHSTSTISWWFILHSISSVFHSASTGFSCPAVISSQLLKYSTFWTVNFTFNSQHSNHSPQIPISSWPSQMPNTALLSPFSLMSFHW